MCGLSSGLSIFFDSKHLNILFLLLPIVPLRLYNQTYPHENGRPFPSYMIVSLNHSPWCFYCMICTCMQKPTKNAELLLPLPLFI